MFVTLRYVITKVKTGLNIQCHFDILCLRMFKLEHVLSLDQTSPLTSSQPVVIPVLGTKLVSMIKI